MNVSLPEHVRLGACSMTYGFCSQTASLYLEQREDVFLLEVSMMFCDNEKEMFLSND